MTPVGNKASTFYQLPTASNTTSLDRRMNCSHQKANERMQEITYTMSIIGCLCIVQDVGYSNLKIKLMIVSDLLNIWVKVFKNGPSKICGRQPLKNLK